MIIGREPLSLDVDGPLVRAAWMPRSRPITGHPPAHVGDMGWADSGVLIESRDFLRDLRPLRGTDTHRSRIRDI